MTHRVGLRFQADHILHAKGDEHLRSDERNLQNPVIPGEFVCFADYCHVFYAECVVSLNKDNYAYVSVTIIELLLLILL